MLKKHFVILFFLLSLGSIKAQTFADSSLAAWRTYLMFRHQDTNYIKNYSQHLTIRVVSNNKYNLIRLDDYTKGTNLMMRPEYNAALGLGFSYKWLSFDFLVNLGIENQKVISTETMDVQLRLYNSKLLMEGKLQYYNGYKVFRYNSKEIQIDEERLHRQDISTTTFGVSGYYAWNYNQFSLKAPFVGNEVQLKSKGSPILGAAFNYINIDADSSLIPKPAQFDFDEKMNLTRFNTMSFAAGLGYIHSFVVQKRFFLTLGFIPCLSLNYGDFKYFENPKETILWRPSFQLKALNALGYNYKKIFCGIQYVGDFINISYVRRLNLLYSLGSVKFYIGYRFNTKTDKIK